MSSAAYEDSDSDEDHSLETRTKGLAAAAQLRVTTAAADGPNTGGVGAAAASSASHEEAWMINLGRGNDNEWLTGPRDDAWYTGVHPRDCPGMYRTGTVLCVTLCRLRGVLV